MTETRTRFTFQPLETRGVFLGLSTSQILALIAGLVIAFGTRTAAGDLPALVVLGGSSVAVLYRRDGEPIGAWGYRWAVQRSRRRRGPDVAPDPLLGDTARSERRGGGVDLRSIAPGLTVTAGRQGAVVIDRWENLRTAVIEVSGGSLSLLDTPDQLQRLEAWRAALGVVGRPGSPVRKVQWVARTWHAATGGPPAPGTLSVVPPGAAGVAVDSYRRLVAAAPPGTRHGSWLAVSVDARRHPSGGSTPEEVLFREMSLVEGQLRRSGLQPSSALTPSRLAAAMDGALLDGPMAVEEHWGDVRVDGRWYCTFWICEWPRLEVGPAFLSPLLHGVPAPGEDRNVAVIMAPVPAARAMREVRSGRTADLADEQLRVKAGFLPSARRQMEREGSSRREAELADGHGEFRFSGYVTVGASDPPALAAACAGVEQLAQAARIELRRLWGRQAEALGWTQPLGRGLRR